MPQLCECEACATAARRMNYITQLIEWSFPHVFTAHNKVIIHFNQDDPDEIEIEEGHQAQQDLLRIFRLVESIHINSREIRSINHTHNRVEAYE